MKALVVLVMVSLLGACGSLGLAVPKSFDQQLAEAYGTHTAVLRATTTAVTAGSLSLADGEAINKMATESRGVLDAAKAAENSGDMAGAQNKLGLALTALTALQGYLNSHGGK